MALQSVWQEHVFSSSICADPLRTLAWSGLFATPMYLLVIPLSAAWKHGWDNAWNTQVSTPAHSVCCTSRFLHSCCCCCLQGDAIKCFFGITPLPPGCIAGAAPVLICYILAYAAFFFLLAILIQRESAMYQALVITVITPITAIVLSFKGIMGRFYEPMAWYNIFGLLLISAGLVVYRYDDFKGGCRRTSSDSDTEQATLLQASGSTSVVGSAGGGDDAVSHQRQLSLPRTHGAMLMSADDDVDDRDVDASVA